MTQYAHRELGYVIHSIELINDLDNNEYVSWIDPEGYKVFTEQTKFDKLFVELDFGIDLSEEAEEDLLEEYLKAIHEVVDELPEEVSEIQDGPVEFKVLGIHLI